MTGVFVADLQQQFEPDIEVLVVALQVLVQEWERLQIGAMPGGDLGASMADQIKCCKVLAVPLPHAKTSSPAASATRACWRTADFYLWRPQFDCVVGAPRYALPMRLARIRNWIVIMGSSSFKC